jgi:hypothetical protein
MIVCFAISGCIEKNHCADATDSTAAYKFAMESVESRLISPSSAVFPKMSASRVTVYQKNFTPNAERCSFVINGFVDSQNAFGAMVRSNFRVETDYDHDLKLWLPTSIIVE